MDNYYDLDFAISQLDFMVLEKIIRDFKKNADGVEPEKVRKCAVDRLKELGLIEVEHCCSCLIPTDKGIAYRKTVLKKLEIADDDESSDDDE